MLTAGFGTNLPSIDVRSTTASGGQADIARTSANDRVWTRPGHRPARGLTAATSIENDSYRPQGPRVRVLAQSNPSKRRRRFINLHIDGIDLIEHVRLFVCGMIK